MSQNHKLSQNWWYILWRLGQNKKHPKWITVTRNYYSQIIWLNLLFTNKCTTTFVYRGERKLSTDTDIFSIASAKSWKFVPLMWRARLRMTVGLSNRNWHLPTYRCVWTNRPLPWACPMRLCCPRVFLVVRRGLKLCLGAVIESFCKNSDFCEYYHLLSAGRINDVCRTIQ